MGYVLGVFPRRMQASPSNLSYDYVIRLSYKNLRTPPHFIGCFFLMIDTAMKKGSSCVFHQRNTTVDGDLVKPKEEASNPAL